jgi:hypothetical protein
MVLGAVSAKHHVDKVTKDVFLEVSGIMFMEGFSQANVS